MFDVSLCVDDDEYLVAGSEAKKISELPRRQRLVERERSIKRIRHGPTTESETNFDWRSKQSTQNVPTNEIRLQFGEHWLHFLFKFKNRFISMTSKWSAADKCLVKSAGGLMRHILTSLWSDSRNVLLAPLSQITGGWMFIISKENTKFFKDFVSK